MPAGLNGVVAITAGSVTSYAVKADGTVVGWGYPYYKVVPTNTTGVAALSIGEQHAVAIKTDGTVAVWGRISGADASTPCADPADGRGEISVFPIAMPAGLARPMVRLPPHRPMRGCTPSL